MGSGDATSDAKALLWVGYFQPQPRLLLAGSVWRAVVKAAARASRDADASGCRIPQWVRHTRFAEDCAPDSEAEALQLLADLSVFTEWHDGRAYQQMLLRCPEGLAVHISDELPIALHATTPAELLGGTEADFVSRLCNTDDSSHTHTEHRHHNPRHGTAVAAAADPNPWRRDEASFTPPCEGVRRLCRALRDLTRVNPGDSPPKAGHRGAQPLWDGGYDPLASPGLAAAGATSAELEGYVAGVLWAAFPDEPEGSLPLEAAGALVLLTAAAKGEKGWLTVASLAGAFAAALLLAAKMMGDGGAGAFSRLASAAPAGLGAVRLRQLEVSVLAVLGFNAFICPETLKRVATMLEAGGSFGREAPQARHSSPSPEGCSPVGGMSRRSSSGSSRSGGGGGDFQVHCVEATCGSSCVDDGVGVVPGRPRRGAAAALGDTLVPVYVTQDSPISPITENRSCPTQSTLSFSEDAFG